MIKKYLSCNEESFPFLLKPIGKDYLWGGNRLKNEFNKDINMTPLAETWECSTHKDGQSIVDSGIFKGLTLNEVLKQHPEFLGKYKNTEGQLPIIVKLIDAQQNLSIQVHPNDSYALKHENGESGKNEMWYVLDANQDTNIIYGFNTNMNKRKVEQSIENNTIEKYLNKINIKKGDSFYIKAGTIHGIGAGALIAEIQENSNITYRLYDYNRKDKNGKLRELHIKKALNVVDYKKNDENKKKSHIYKYEQGYKSELICKCKYFKVYKDTINEEYIQNNYLNIKIKHDSFNIFLCIDGKCSLFNHKSIIDFYKGDCIFVPAHTVNFQLKGDSILLKITC